MLLHRLHEISVVLPNRQGLPLLQDLPEPCGKGSPRVLVHLQLGNGCVLGLGGGNRGGGGRRGGRGGASASVIISSTLGVLVENRRVAIFLPEEFFGYDNRWSESRGSIRER